MAVTYLEISYPNFALGAIIDPEEANQNNYEIVTKINDNIRLTNDNENKVKDLYSVKADLSYVNSRLDNLSGNGRTVETVKGNYDSIVKHKTSTDHDYRYYIKTEIDGKLLNLSGENRTNQTIKGNYDNLIEHKKSKDHDNRYYIKDEINAIISNHKTYGDHDHRYYTKDELTPWLKGGDTKIHEEVYVIVNPNNGDGTFTYTKNGVPIEGMLTEEGYQIFNLMDGMYTVGSNRVEIIINDTLRRSQKSGGLIEIDEKRVALTSPEGQGAEITIKYYERIGMMAEYNIKLGITKPPQNNGNTMWFEELE